MIVKIRKENKIYFWELSDNQCKIPVYGKLWRKKAECIKEWKQFAKNNSIKKWRYYNIFDEIKEEVWNRVR